MYVYRVNFWVWTFSLQIYNFSEEKLRNDLEKNQSSIKGGRQSRPSALLQDELGRGRHEVGGGAGLQPLLGPDSSCVPHFFSPHPCTFQEADLTPPLPHQEVQESPKA